MGENNSALEHKVDALTDEVSAMHSTLGVLLDDVSELKKMASETKSLKQAVADAVVRIRKLEANGKAA